MSIGTARYWLLIWTTYSLLLSNSFNCKTIESEHPEFALNLIYRSNIFHIKCWRIILSKTFLLRDSENRGKNPLSQTRCICEWPLKRYYWEKLTFSKPWFSKFKKFVSRSVFGELQLTQISLNFKTSCWN